MLYYSKGAKDMVFTTGELQDALTGIFEKLGKRSKVLALPPDFTRFHSFAGAITEMAWRYYGNALTDVLPALGTHAPMTGSEIGRMFGNVPSGLFRVHDWRNDVVTVGTIPSELVHRLSEGKVDYSWPAQVNSLVMHGGHDLILSIGQVVPHEVIGMANYNKNIFVGTGGAEGINKSHFVGAVYGMERIMGRAESPVRSLLNYASEHFTRHLPIVYIQTVVGKDDAGKLQIRGLYAGDDFECFRLAAELSLQVNFLMVEKPVRKAVVWLDPEEFKSTWLGNKSVYRTRMALADGAELIVLAPGLKEFGEDKEIDRLIRKYGYAGTPATLEAVRKNADLSQNLSAAAHLIHGSSEGRFTVTYCPGHLTRREIESVHFNYAPLEEMLQRYNPQTLTDGFHTLPDGEEICYISNPALGLWAHKSRFEQHLP
ncbi:MAG: lactate racemase domain-containing protein [Bacteroidales bacterium]|jgi:nickel-dependent lactate racemase|nr:lactate racemase domain-containing protein [Bacteroidales bacterium]